MCDRSIETLKISIEGFIHEKRLMGYRYKNEEQSLLHFLKFVTQNKLTPLATKDTIMQWVDNAKNAVCRNQRIAVIRQFALHLNRSNKPAYTVPTAFRSIEHDHFCPYIYSRKEIVLLFPQQMRSAKSEKPPTAKFPFL